MKNTLLILIAFLPFRFHAQSLYSTAGAQCGAHGSGGCLHYQTPCPPEYDAEIRFVLRTDNQGQETSWQLLDVTDNVVILSENNLLSAVTYDVRHCVNREHCYRLTINDTGGNGIDPAIGGYLLEFNGDKVAEGGVFTTSEAVEVGACCGTLQVDLAGGFACYDPDAGQVVATANGGVPPYRYFWAVDGPFYSLYTMVIQVSSGDQQVVVIVTDAAGCEAADTLAVGELSQLTTTVQSTPTSVKGAADGQARVVPAGGIAPYTYHWSNGVSTAIAGSLAAGSYTVTVLDAGGCSAVQGVLVEDGPSGIAEGGNSIIGFTLFPNPANGEVQVQFNVQENGRGLIEVLDGAGQIRQRRHIRAVAGENRLTLDMGHLPPGTYMVWIRIEKGHGSQMLVVMP